MGVTIQNLVVWEIFKFVWWWAVEQYFDHQDHCSEPTLRSNIDPNMPEHLLRLTLVRYNNNTIAVHTIEFW